MIPAIEMCRGIAAFMVLVSHYSLQFFDDTPQFFPFLYTGVDAFFVLSGFVFGRSTYERFEVTSYALRRFFRIYPLYAFSLGLYYLVTPTVEDKGWIAIKHLLFLQNNGDHATIFLLNPAYWTLPVEVQYYALLPLLSLIQARWTYAILALIIPALAFKLFLTIEGAPSSTFLLKVLNFNLPGQLPEFLIGTYLYKVHITLSARHRRICATATLLAGTGLICGLAEIFITYGDAGISHSTFLKAFFNIFCALGYALIIFSVLHATRNLSSRHISVCLLMGEISYGVYLFHNLPFHVIHRTGISHPGGIVTSSISTAAVILFSLAGYRFLEHPCREYGRYLSKLLTLKISSS